jgi:hypothetical protein
MGAKSKKAMRAELERSITARQGDQRDTPPWLPRRRQVEIHMTYEPPKSTPKPELDDGRSERAALTRDPNLVYRHVSEFSVTVAHPEDGGLATAGRAYAGPHDAESDDVGGDSPSVLLMDYTMERRLRFNKDEQGRRHEDGKMLRVPVQMAAGGGVHIQYHRHGMMSFWLSPDEKEIEVTIKMRRVWTSTYGDDNVIRETRKYPKSWRQPRGGGARPLPKKPGPKPRDGVAGVPVRVRVAQHRARQRAAKLEDKRKESKR